MLMSVFKNRFTSHLLRRRWVVATFFALSIFVVALLKQPGGFRDLNFHFLRIVFIYGFALPVMLGAMLSLLHNQTELANIMHQLDLQRLLRQKLAGAQNWADIINVLVEFLPALPMNGASLYVYNPASAEYELAGEWGVNEYQRSEASPSMSLSYCSVRMKSQSPDLEIFTPCCCLSDLSSLDLNDHYCLPLVHGSLQIAVLHLSFPHGSSSNHFDQFIELAPEVAFSVERIQLQHLTRLQTSANQVERVRIARYLHDTLGDSLAYLRLKLDEFTHENSMQEIKLARWEFDRIRSVANQAYEQVRRSLVDLQEGGLPALDDDILETAQGIGDRANFEVLLHSKGNARVLPARVQRQILYILREGLRNVEKHAKAQKVSIEIQWGEDDLIIKMMDNGQGFDADAVHLLEGHYGLRIMQECATELNGYIALTSEKNVGTNTTLWLPV